MLTRNDFKKENWQKTLETILAATIKDGSIESPTPPPEFISWLMGLKKYEYQWTITIASTNPLEAGTSKISISEIA